MSEPRKYSSQGAFDRAAAYRNIEHVPRGKHPPREVTIGGRRQRETPGRGRPGPGLGGHVRAALEEEADVWGPLVAIALVLAVLVGLKVLPLP